ncbi:hypothetical protein IWQ60_007804, partial [Tieghemiomyces parasiticus]
MSSSCVLLWSPHPRSQDFVLVQDHTLRMYRWQPPSDSQPNQESTVLALCHNQRKIDCVSWSHDPVVQDLVALGVGTGQVLILRLSEHPRTGSGLPTPLSLSAQLPPVPLPETSLPILPRRPSDPEGLAAAAAGSSTRLAITHGRNCQSLSFSPHEHKWLAVGLARHRNEHGLLIWDTERLQTTATLGPLADDGDYSGLDPLTVAVPTSPDTPAIVRPVASTASSPGSRGAPAASPGNPRRPLRMVYFTTSNPRNPSVDRPVATFSFKESVAAMAWLDAYPKCLLVGGLAATRPMIHMYDIRKNKAAFRHETPAVYGLASDPFDPYRFASYAAGGNICVWDTRFMLRELLHIDSGITSEKAWQKMAFSPHRRGILACLGQETDFIKLNCLETVSTQHLAANPMGNAGDTAWSLPSVESHEDGATTPAPADVPRVPDTFLWRTRLIHTDPPAPLTAFTWIPTDTPAANRYRMLTLNRTGNLESRTIEEVPRAAWNPHGSLAVADEAHSKILDPWAVIPPAGSDQNPSLAAAAPALSAAGELANLTSLADLPNLFARRATLRQTKEVSPATARLRRRVTEWGTPLTSHDAPAVAQLRGDISMVMKQRAAQGYGMDPARNLTIIGSDTALREAWAYIRDSVELMDEDAELIAGNHRLSFMGIQKVLRELSKRDFALLRTKLAELEARQGNDSDDPRYPGPELTVQRKLALRMSGCHYNRRRLEEILVGLEKAGSYEQAAAIALFHDCRERCITALARSGRPELEMVAMVLAAHAARAVDRSNTAYIEEWQTMNRRFLQGTPTAPAVTDPYLRAIFKYYYNEDWSDVLNEQGLSMKERLSIALRFLDDQKLLAYVKENTEATTKTGNLEGLILTGLTDHDMPLLRAYVNATADVQTAALILSFSSVQPSPDSVKDRCVEGYRDLLDQWTMYTTRANFDIARGKWFRRYHITTPMMAQSQTIVRCTYCNINLMQNLNLVGGAGVAVAGIDRESGGRRFPYMGTNRFDATVGDTSMQCPACKAPLPSCPICLLSLGTPPAVFTATTGKNKRGEHAATPIP